MTVDGGDNDAWSVADGSAAPKVERSFATRYWMRLDRLEDHLDDPENEHNPDWPVMLKANLAIGTTLDDPDWWDSGAGGVDAEDIWNWANFSYLKLSIDAPRAGDIELVVDYDVPAISDPCYTCFEHRYGASGTFSYSRTPKQLTYTIALASGSNEVLIDLALSDEEVVPSGDARIQVVSKLTLNLLANDTGSAEEWDLDELELTLDPGETGRSEPSDHITTRFKRAWDWLSADWFGFGAEVDGLDALEIDFGYGSSLGYTRHEAKMLYIQHRQHCPDSALSDRLDYAKALSALAGQLNWQEGWSATDHDPATSSHNRDADLNTLRGTFRWWDLRQCEEWAASTSVPMDGAVCVATWKIIAGVRHDVYFYKYPRGRVRGLMLADTNRGMLRIRSAGAIWLEGKRDGDPTWSVVAAGAPDEHAAFHIAPPVREKDWSYRIKE